MAETEFQYILFVLCVNSPHAGNLSGLDVIQIQSVRDSKDDDLRTPYRISSLRQQPVVLTADVKFGHPRVYQILVYRHELS